MVTSDANHLSEHYADLSDRFRSLWTFYQFLSGVFKHHKSQAIPFSYDFQALYRQLQDNTPRMGVEEGDRTRRELDHVQRELQRIQQELAKLERDFAPSVLRRFFDHLKRQDEKILFALVKFYLMSPTFDQDTLDKLDILLTRLAEAPLASGQALQRDRSELLTAFERLAAFAGLASLPPAEERPLVEAVREFRAEVAAIDDFESLLTSEIYDRFRRLKQRLGRSFLHPPILVEIVATNIAAKNRFTKLYQDEEVRILEDTNRIFEIERYLERNPDLAHEDLRRQIETFRRYRQRYDSGRREDNLKREDILELRRAMQGVLELFDPLGTRRSNGRGAAPTGSPPDATDHSTRATAGDEYGGDSEASGEETETPEVPSLTDLIPPDPLLTESLHKIMFALELVVWDRPPEQAVHAQELHYLRLEPWEVEAYRRMAEQEATPASRGWDLLLFYLTSAALRVKMEEERTEIERLSDAGSSQRLIELLDRAAQSLERARDVDRRFLWFVDDMLYRGSTDHLEQMYRSRFRFMRAYSSLWLEHQEAGGVTPL